MFFIISDPLSDKCFELVPCLIVLLSDGGPHLLLKLQVIRLLVHLEVFDAVGLGVGYESAHGLGLYAEFVENLFQDHLVVADL